MSEKCFSRRLLLNRSCLPLSLTYVFPLNSSVCGLILFASSRMKPLDQGGFNEASFSRDVCRISLYRVRSGYEAHINVAYMTWFYGDQPTVCTSQRNFSRAWKFLSALFLYLFRFVLPQKIILLNVPTCYFAIWSIYRAQLSVCREESIKFSKTNVYTVSILRYVLKFVSVLSLR